MIRLLLLIFIISYYYISVLVFFGHSGKKPDDTLVVHIWPYFVTVGVTLSEILTLCCTKSLKTEGVFSTVGHVQKAVLVFLLVVELAHSQTATKQTATNEEGLHPAVDFLHLLSSFVCSVRMDYV